MSRPSAAPKVAVPVSMTRDALLDVEEDLTPYERERAAQLARNRERLAALDLPAAAARLAPVVKPQNVAAAKKGVAARKKREVRR